MGFEPTSENLQPEAHTCLSPHLTLTSSGALGRAPESASPVFSRLPAPDGFGKTSLMFDVPSAAQAIAGRRASLN